MSIWKKNSKLILWYSALIFKPKPFCEIGIWKILLLYKFLFCVWKWNHLIFGAIKSNLAVNFIFRFVHAEKKCSTQHKYTVKTDNILYFINIIWDTTQSVGCVDLHYWGRQIYNIFNSFKKKSIVLDYSDTHLRYSFVFFLLKYNSKHERCTTNQIDGSTNAVKSKKERRTYSNNTIADQENKTGRK